MEGVRGGAMGMRGKRGGGGEGRETFMKSGEGRGEREAERGEAGGGR